jgi:hypothetical protein
MLTIKIITIVVSNKYHVQIHTHLRYNATSKVFQCKLPTKLIKYVDHNNTGFEFSSIFLMFYCCFFIGVVSRNACLLLIQNCLPRVCIKLDYNTLLISLCVGWFIRVE